jgi:hypothetical protein
MKKLEKIITYLEAVKVDSPYPFKVWEFQKMIDLCQSALKGDISHKTARKIMYEECALHMNSGCYDSSHMKVSEMCLPFVWN